MRTHRARSRFERSDGILRVIELREITQRGCQDPTGHHILGKQYAHLRHGGPSIGGVIRAWGKGEGVSMEAPPEYKTLHEA